MMRLFLILSLLLGSDWPALSLADKAPVRLASQGTVSRVGEIALSPSVVFMAHALTASAFAVRRLVEPYAWAAAGDSSVGTKIWEFEPAVHRQRPSNLNSEDQGPLSGSGSIDWFWTDKATSLLQDVRQHPMRIPHVPKERRALEGEAFGLLVGQGVPTELARRVAHQVALRTYREDPLTWMALGQRLVAEVDQLRLHVGLPDHVIAAALPKLSADDVQQLWEWLQRVDRSFALTILDRAIQAADPAAAARLYVDNYRMAFRAARKLDPAHAATLAGQVFAMRDALKKIKAKIKTKIKAQIPPDRSKWALLLIAALGFAAWQQPGSASLAHTPSWLSANLSFGPLWPLGSLTKRQQDFLGSPPDAVLASAA